jgi:hypothetical protein
MANGIPSEAASSKPASGVRGTIGIVPEPSWRACQVFRSHGSRRRLGGVYMFKGWGRTIGVSITGSREIVRSEVGKRRITSWELREIRNKRME